MWSLPIAEERLAKGHNETKYIANILIYALDGWPPQTLEEDVKLFWDKPQEFAIEQRGLLWPGLKRNCSLA